MLAIGQDLVECLLKVGCTLSEITTHLFHVFFVALFDFFAEQLTQGSIAEAFFALAGMIGDEIRHQRPGKPSSALYRISAKEWVDLAPGGGRRRGQS